MKRIFTAFLCLFAMVGMAQNIVFQETFDNYTTYIYKKKPRQIEGGNDGKFSGVLAGSTSITPQNNGLQNHSEWGLKSVYKAQKCIKLGKGIGEEDEARGELTTPAVSLTGNGSLSFRVAGWGLKNENKQIIVTIAGGTFDNGTTEQEITLQQAAWTTHIVNIFNGNNQVKITFKGKESNHNRFFLDDVVVKTAPANLNITIGSALYTTFFTDKAYTMPEGLTGNTVTVSGTTAMLTASYPAGSSVPANTPLLISGTQGNHDATILSGTIAPVSATNLLKGTLTEQAITASGGKVYVFAKDDTDGLGFYWQNGTTGTTLTNAAGKCYLEVSGGSGVQGFRLDGTLTAIEAAATEKADEQIYDLSGRRVSNAGRGLYIVNGKKVIR